MDNLITCPACYQRVSKAAEKCPHCGHPIKPKTASGCLIFLGVILVIIGLFWWPALIIGILIFIWAAVSKS